MPGRRALLFAASIIALLSFANPALAQNFTANQTFLVAAAQYAQCKTNFTVSYIGKVTAAVPGLSGLGQYSTALQTATSQLSSLAGRGNVTQFRTYLSGNYDQELNLISKNFTAQIRAANLSRSQTSQLRQQYNSTFATYTACRLNSVKNVAMKELALFNSSISEYQNEASSLSQQGLNTSAMNLLLQGAKAQIIAPLASAVSQATNASQISAALNKYCLFDACRNGTNFHLAAHFELQKFTAELNYLEAKGNVSSSSLAPAQTYLNAATSLLQAVGTAAYTNGQGNAIFANLTSASKAMQQARQQQAFAKAKLSATSVISSYANAISSYRASIAQLAAKGIPTGGLNQTLSNATSAIIVPLQNALNSSANVTQLYNAFKTKCIENGCANGTNFNLGAKLKLGEAQAELTYLANKASASANVIVNATALSTAQGYVANASALIGSANGMQLTNGLISKITAESNGFTVAIKNAYTVVAKKPSPIAVSKTPTGPTAPIVSPKPPANTATTPRTAPTPTPPTAPGRNALPTPITIKANTTIGGVTSTGPVPAANVNVPK